MLVPIGSPAPNAPDYTDIIPGDSRYQVIDPAEGYQQNGQLSSEHVTQYAMKRQGEDYAYTVEYRDRDTGEEVAPAQRGTSSAVTLTFYAPAIANYRAEAESATLTITAEGPNLLTFWYVAVPVTADGNTIYRYNAVTVYSTAGVAGGGAGGGAGAGAGGGEGGGEVIYPDETPLTGGETTEPETSGPTEEINPDETPQTNAPEEESSGLSPMVGVGIGGTFDYAPYLAKKALARPLDRHNTNPEYAEMEEELLSRINSLGIGPQGFGGDISALACNIETYPTHIAGLPVAVNVNCHVMRRKSTLI